MNYEVTTSTGTKTISIVWPDAFKKVGIFVSGGIDSALMLWMYAQLTPPEQGQLIPLHATRGCPVCEQAAHDVVSKINSLFNLSLQLKIVKIEKDRNGMTNPLQRAFDAVQKDEPVDCVISGDTQNPPIELPGNGWSIRQPVERQNSFPRWKLPLLHINKTHTVQLVKDLGQEWIYSMTRSCVTLGVPKCGYCWTCSERAWAFSSTGILDTGTL